MRTMGARVLLIGGCIILAIWLGYFYGMSSMAPPSHALVKRNLIVGDSRPENLAQRLLLPEKTYIPLPPAESKQTQSMRDKFSRLSDGRLFALDAWNRPEQGGRFYASYVVDRCRFAAAFTEIQTQGQPETPKKISDHVNVIAAFDRIKRICGQFTKDELDSLSGLSAISQNKLVSDTYLVASEKLSSAEKTHDTRARQEAIDSILGTGDPLLIDSIGMKLSIFRDGGGIFLYFDGQKYYVNTAPPLMAAFYLLPCGMGLGCDISQDLDLQLTCASGGQCYTDRFAKVLAVDAGGDASRYQMILNSYASLLAAVKNKNVEKFIPK